MARAEDILRQLVALEMLLHQELEGKVVTVFSGRRDSRGRVVWAGDGEVVLITGDGRVEAFPYGAIARIAVH